MFKSSIYFLRAFIEFNGDIMNLIKEYIKKITVKDILEYAKKENIIINEKEALIILNYGKENIDTLLYGDPENLFKKLKKEIRPELYKEIYKLYIKAKIKYLN